MFGGHRRHKGFRRHIQHQREPQTPTDFLINRINKEFEAPEPLQIPEHMPPPEPNLNERRKKIIQNERRKKINNAERQRNRRKEKKRFDEFYQTLEKQLQISSTT